MSLVGAAPKSVDLPTQVTFENKANKSPQRKSNEASESATSPASLKKTRGFYKEKTSTAFPDLSKPQFPYSLRFSEVST